MAAAGSGGLFSGIVSGIGDAVGAHLALGELNDAKGNYDNAMGQGINAQQQGLDQANAAYQPYTGAASQGISSLGSAINGRQMAAQPQSSSYNVNDYMNPSAAYSTSQANTATQSSSLAHGGLGGGLAKALSNNANKMGMTNYNNAYQQMIDTNSQKFNQGQQQYVNKTDFDQSQIGNRQNYATLALQGLSQGQQLGHGYRDTISSMYGKKADTAMSIGENKASLANTATQSATNSIGAGGGSFLGGKPTGNGE